MTMLLGLAVVALAIVGGVATLVQIGRVVTRAGKRVGAWWRDKARAIARVRDHRDNGHARLQTDTLASLMAEFTKMREERDVLQVRVRSLVAEIGAQTERDVWGRAAGSVS